MRLFALVAAPVERQRDQVRDEFRTLHAQFKLNMELLFGGRNHHIGDSTHIRWMRGIVESNSTRRGLLAGVNDQIQSMADLIKSGHTPTFDEAMSFYEQVWPVIRDKMTEIIWDLWADLDSAKVRALKENTELKAALDQTLSDIKRISTSIRMVSINTTTLAVHSQGNQVGFKFLAEEVKVLAESIDRSANEARKSIAGLI